MPGKDEDTQATILGKHIAAGINAKDLGSSNTINWQGHYFIIYTDKDQNPVDFVIQGSKDDIEQWKDQLARRDLSYYNANSVELFQDACRIALTHANLNSNTETQLALTDISTLAKSLDKLKALLNTHPADPVDAITKLEAANQIYTDALTIYLNQLPAHPSLAPLIYDLKRNLAHTQQQFNTQIKKLQEGTPPLDKDNMAYLFSAQDRDTINRIHSLGHFLNDQTNALCEAIEKIIVIPELGNTQISDQMILSDIPKAFANAGRAIKRQNSLAYKQYVNTHAPTAEVEEIAADGGYLHLKDYITDMTPTNVNALLNTLLPGNDEAEKPWYQWPWSVWPQRFIRDYVALVSGPYDDLSKTNPDRSVAANVTLVFVGILSSVILIIPLLVALAEFAATTIVAAAAFAIDIVRLVVQVPLFIIAAVVNPFTSNEFAKKIVTLGGLFDQSLLNRFQNWLTRQRVDVLANEDANKKDLLTKLTKRYDRLSFLNVSPGEVAAGIASMARNAGSSLYNFFIYTHDPIDTIALMTARFQEQKAIQAIIETGAVATINKQNSPPVAHYHMAKPTDAIRVGRSPVAAVNEIFLGLSDDLIGSFRQNYKLPSTLGYATAWATLGTNMLIPAAIIAKLHLTGVARGLQVVPALFGKHFMGHADLTGDLQTEFFSLILQWKAGDVTVEFIGSLTEDEKSFLDNLVNNFEIYIPVLAAGMATGYAFGMLPTIASPFAMPINVLIEEAKTAQAGTMPLTSIEYTFLMGKMAYLGYTMVETDLINPKEQPISEEIEKLCLAYMESDEVRDPERLINAIEAAIKPAVLSDEKKDRLRTEITNASNYAIASFIKALPDGSDVSAALKEQKQTQTFKTCNLDTDEKIDKWVEKYSTNLLETTAYLTAVKQDMLNIGTIKLYALIKNTSDEPYTTESLQQKLKDLRDESEKNRHLLVACGLTDDATIDAWAVENINDPRIIQKASTFESNNNEDIESPEQFNRIHQRLHNLREALQDPMFHADMAKLTRRQRTDFYIEMNQLIDNYNKRAFCLGMADQMLNKEARQNLMDAFFNRYVRMDYPALIRLPVALAYPALRPLRALGRGLRLGFNWLFYHNNLAEVKTSIDMERAVDKVFFDDWFGVGRRNVYQFSYTGIQTVIMLIEIVLFPLILIAWVGTQVLAIFGFTPPYTTPITMAAALEYQLNRTPTYMADVIAFPIAAVRSLVSGQALFNTETDAGTEPGLFSTMQAVIEFDWIRGRQTYASTAANAHRGGNYSDVNAAAKQLPIPAPGDVRVEPTHAIERAALWEGDVRYNRRLLSKYERFDYNKNKSSVTTGSTMSDALDVISSEDRRSRGTKLYHAAASTVRRTLGYKPPVTDADTTTQLKTELDKITGKNITQSSASPAASPNTNPSSIPKV